MPIPCSTIPSCAHLLSLLTTEHPKSRQHGGLAAAMMRLKQRLTPCAGNNMACPSPVLPTAGFRPEPGQISGRCGPLQPQRILPADGLIPMRLTPDEVVIIRQTTQESVDRGAATLPSKATIITPCTTTSTSGTAAARRFRRVLAQTEESCPDGSDTVLVTDSKKIRQELEMRSRVEDPVDHLRACVGVGAATAYRPTIYRRYPRASAMVA